MYLLFLSPSLFLPLTLPPLSSSLRGEAPYDQDNTIVYYNTDSSNGKSE